MYDGIYRSMLSSSSSGFAIAELNGSILWKNDAFSKLTKPDFKTSDSSKLRIFDIFFEEEHGIIESLIQLAIRNGSSFDLLRDVKRGSGGNKFPARLVFTRHSYMNSDFLCLELVDVSNEFSKRRLKGENTELQTEIAHRKTIEAQLQRANEKLERLAFLDGLTGLGSRRLFDDRIAIEFKRCLKDKLPLSLIMCDVDFFKPYNDSFGHLGGDECLKRIARTMQEICVRECDLVARYGGEEFAVLLPETSQEEALRTANKVVESIADLRIAHPKSTVSEFVTVSAGIASVQSFFPVPSPDELIQLADSALYHSKKTGRNKVTFQDKVSRVA